MFTSNPDGTFTVRFLKRNGAGSFSPEQVWVDGRVPVSVRDGKLLYDPHFRHERRPPPGPLGGRMVGSSGARGACEASPDRLPVRRKLSRSGSDDTAGTRERYGIASFFVDIPGLSAETFARLLADSHNIMLSAGNHCAQPYHRLTGLSATVRASTHIYTTVAEVDFFLEAVRELTG